jgi:signal transduction histidine kinase
VPVLWIRGYDASLAPLTVGPAPPGVAPGGRPFDREPLDPGLAAQAARAGSASRTVTVGGQRGRELVRRIPRLSDGCEWVVAGRTLPEDDDAGLVPWLVASLLAPLVVWAALGSPVARLRALAEAVRRSSADEYRTPLGIDSDDEVGDLARAFDEAAAAIRTHVARVEDRERVLRQFVADTTHDLMTPLTVLQGEIAALEASVRPGAAALAAREAQYLASIVHNLATVARLDVGEGELAPEPFDLADVVERVVRRHEPLARRLEVALGWAVPPEALWAMGEATLVEQALGNVVHNAIRHNRAGGHAAVTLDADGGAFVVRVRDDGPGVDDDELGKLTDRAWRSTGARTRSPDGLGLGLTITRRVCDRHGWSLGLRRVDGGGLEAEIRGPTSAPRSDR